MVTGETSFSLDDLDVVAPARALPPKGWYEGKLLLADTLEILNDGVEGKVPFVKFAIELQGERTYRVYHPLWLAIRQGDDGRLSLQKPGQIVDLKNTLGGSVTFPQKAYTTTSRTGTPEVAQCLDPQAVQAWLQNYDGMVVPVEIYQRKKRMNGQDTDEMEAVVGSFAARKKNGTNGHTK